MAVTQKIRSKSDEKRGVAPKAYKLNIELANQFKETCDRLGLAQATVLSEFMEEFIKKNEG